MRHVEIEFTQWSSDGVDERFDNSANDKVFRLINENDFSLWNFRICLTARSIDFALGMKFVSPSSVR